jgi:chemotaxis protein CheZ
VTQAAQEEDLDALFDSLSDERQREIAAQHQPVAAAAAPASAPCVAPASADDHPARPVDAEGMYHRIGHLTRQLHEALRELGYDKALEKAAHDIPDARDRLSYIAKVTGQSAERTLSAVELAQHEQDQLRARSGALSKRWEAFFGADMALPDFRALVQDMRIFMMQSQSHAEISQHQLTEIMMAQDFHDLTGQVINRLTTLVQRMESELLKFLIDAIPNERRPEGVSTELEGPVVNTVARKDVVTNQAQVDDLLESLGF